MTDDGVGGAARVREGRNHGGGGTSKAGSRGGDAVRWRATLW